jgi:hypothetical protein
MRSEEVKIKWRLPVTRRIQILTRTHVLSRRTKARGKVGSRVWSEGAGNSESDERFRKKVTNVPISDKQIR